MHSTLKQKPEKIVLHPDKSMDTTVIHETSLTGFTHCLTTHAYTFNNHMYSGMYMHVYM